ncbi:MAG: ABC transporter substrate-binding protein [Ardenticatenaceae bacterium]|nr:ABC transporter substrate-binding protein [Ardenticatenaceae bacterium]
MWHNVSRETGGWRLETGLLVSSLQSLVPFILLILLLTACTHVPPVVKIGLVAPFEGRYREIGYDVIYSARLAVREINQAGGISGYRVALVALDDGGNVELAQATAESLTLDPAVVVVMGHWLTATTAVAAPIYAEAGISFIAMNQPPFLPHNPAQLPAAFRTAYEAVTPFDEVASDYAGVTYDALQLVWLGMARGMEMENGRLTRQSVMKGLDGLEYEGITGRVYWRLETGD